MPMKMDDFLKKYYNQLHFNSMPVEVRAQFEDWVAANALTDEMKDWVNDCLQRDQNGNLIRNNMGYEPKPMPDAQNANDVSDDELKKIFIAFQNAFVSMASAKSGFKRSNPDAYEFVEDFFGPNALFNINAATQEEENSIAQIVAVLNNNPDLKKYIQQNTKKENGTDLVFEDASAVKNFLDDVQGHKYNSDYKTQAKLRQVARVLSGVLDPWNDAFDPASAERQALGGIKDDLDKIGANNAFSGNGQIDPQKFEQFKGRIINGRRQAGDIEVLLDKLYNNQNIYSVFKEHDSGKISKHIEKARKTINWQDAKGPNYVPPKMEDELTLGQRIEKWVTDTYSDSLKKYEELRGGPLPFTPESKDIFKAIDSNKIKPTDGLSGLLDKADAVKKKLRNPVSKQHWEWFVEVMGPIKDAMPKAVAGAWKNGSQMKAVVQEIILKGADPNNPDPHALEKAQTALSIMSAMRYGMLTSKVMDAIRKEPMTIFSDKSLSWNKHEGMQFVTNALDKSIKAAFVGVGYAVTFVGNKIRMSNRKFRNKDNNKGRLGQYYQAERDRLSREHDDFERQKGFKDAQDRQAINQQQQTIAGLDSQANRNNGTNVTAANLTQRQADRDAQATIRDNNQQAHNDFEANEGIVNDYQSRLSNRGELRRQLRDKTTKIADKRAELMSNANPIDPVTGQPLPPGAAQAIQARIQQELDALIAEKDALEHNIANADTWLRDATNVQNFRNARAFVNDPAHINANQAYLDADQKYNELKSNIDQYNSATQSINELNDALDRRQAALDNWPQTHINRIKYLEDFWNFLADGNATTWSLSQKRAEKKFRQNKDALLANYVQSHGMAD